MMTLQSDSDFDLVIVVFLLFAERNCYHTQADDKIIVKQGNE